MYSSNIKTLINKLEKIGKLREPISATYLDIINNIEIAQCYDMDFRHTLKLDDEDFFINKKAIDKKTKLIRSYAVGINDRNTKANRLRHDDEDHHDDKKSVKEINPPHHKHKGSEEMVRGFSGDIDDLINDYKNILS